MQNWWNLNNPYSYRNDNLKQMGFKSYQSYLKSDLWKGIRAKVFTRSQGKCEKCGEKASQVHHRAYDPATLKGESIHALTAVCAGCHKRVENRPSQPGDHLGQMAYQRLQRANMDVLKKKRRKKKWKHKPKQTDGYWQFAPFWAKR